MLSTQDFQDVFAALRALYAPFESACVVTCDQPGRYALGTHEVRAHDGYRTGFGGVTINKRYVSAHLIPAYVHPDLLRGISAALKKRMQGKSCFNFTVADDRLFEELGNLIVRGAAMFTADGRI